MLIHAPLIYLFLSFIFPQQKSHHSPPISWRHKSLPGLPHDQQLRRRKQSNWEIIGPAFERIAEELYDQYKQYDLVVIVDVQNICKDEERFGKTAYHKIQEKLVTGEYRQKIKDFFFADNPDVSPERCGWIFVTQANLDETGDEQIVVETYPL